MEIVRYGPAPSQFAELHLPHGEPAPTLVVLIHGGFWRAAYDLGLMRPLADDLTARGHVAWNVEYRRVGEPGGGWPGTLADVATALDTLAEIAPARRIGRIGLRDVVVAGHSAGGHLALWLAGRHRLAQGLPGADPRVRPHAVVSQAGVADLRSADAAGIGENAAAGLLGGRSVQVPDRYGVASPRELVPLGVPQLLVHGDADDRVPVTQSRDYAAAARTAGDRVDLAEYPGMGHFELIDPAHESWRAVLAWLAARSG